MVFKYIALNSAGKKITGTREGKSKDDLIIELKNEQLVPLNIKEISKEAATSIWEKDIGNSDIHKKKLPRKLIFNFLNEMALMLKSGVSLSQALSVITTNERNKPFKQILGEISEDLYSGISISNSMKRFKCFPTLVINIIAAGETSGNLDESFMSSANLLEKEMWLVSKVRGTLIYPCFLIALTMGLIIIINIVVIPNFSKIFAQFDAELPAITKGLLAFSKFSTQYGIFILIAFVLAIFGFIYLNKNNDRFRYTKDKWILKIPLFGKLFMKSNVARFARVMATLVESGADIVSSLVKSKEVIKNKYIAGSLDNICEAIKKGIALSDSMKNEDVFDSLIISMIKVGEETGNLEETLNKVASLYELQTDQLTKNITSMLEPAMTIVIAVVVGFVVISIVLPMFQMYDIIK